MHKILAKTTKNILAGLMLTFAFIGSISASETNGSKVSTTKQGYFSDTLVNKKIILEQAKTNIKLYPNPSNGIVHVSNSNLQTKELQFYIFDLEGTMIENIHLNGMEKRTITGLHKGIYVYEVFTDDVSVERGKIVVK